MNSLKTIIKKVLNESKGIEYIQGNDGNGDPIALFKVENRNGVDINSLWSEFYYDEGEYSDEVFDDPEQFEFFIKDKFPNSNITIDRIYFEIMTP